MPNEGGSLIPLDVFISFSRQDMGAADRVCEALEASGLRCWMAHRDIAPGRGYLGPVLEAADHCRAVLLLASSHTATSNSYVMERSARRGVPIIWLTMDHATPPAEFEGFRESAVVIDASEPPLESHFQPLAARINSLLNPTTEDRHELPSAPAERPNLVERDSAGYSLDESDLLNERIAPLAAGFASDAVEDRAIESALRIVAEVLSELRPQGPRRVPPDAAANVRPMPPLAAREQLPTEPARSEVLHPGIRLHSPSTGKHTKRKFALVVTGLALLAFVAGVLFSKEIIGQLHAIEEFLRNLGAVRVMRLLSLVVACVQVRIDDLAATVVMSARHYQYTSHTA
jgi:TIR domain